MVGTITALAIALPMRCLYAKGVKTFLQPQNGSSLDFHSCIMLHPLDMFMICTKKRSFRSFANDMVRLNLHYIMSAECAKNALCGDWKSA